MDNSIKINKALVCNSEETVIEVARRMRESNERHVFVINSMIDKKIDSNNNNQKLVGIISTVDICNKIVAEGKSLSTMVKDVMNPVETVEKKQDEEYALKIMMERNTFTCPVVDNGIFLGVVNYNDIFQKVVQKVK
ncbi:MAG: cyclic nucleotide-binding/CBS domain-containing protein [Candidatus Woesearchaeota archaeon]